jgi:fatty-acyl-CoA synthase/long-chain acyl-CoA synthetase
MQSDLLTADGWLDTGDLGYVNEDGYVFFVDRKKDMINRGGEKIWCNDLEEELISLEGIKDAAVVGIPSEKYGEVAAAVVVPENGARLTEEGIQEALRQKVARYKIPERILFVDQVPKTPGLKSDKKYIRTLFD